MLAADTGPMNKSKAVFAKLSLIYLELHNSLDDLQLYASRLGLAAEPGQGQESQWGLRRGCRSGCPVSQCGHGRKPHAEAVRGYWHPDSQPDPGVERPRHEYEGAAEPSTTKAVPKWYFADASGKWKSGICQINPAQMEIAIDMLYAEFGWDKATGMPTRATFERLGMKAIADALAAKVCCPKKCAARDETKEKTPGNRGFSFYDMQMEREFHARRRKDDSR